MTEENRMDYLKKTDSTLVRKSLFESLVNSRGGIIGELFSDRGVSRLKECFKKGPTTTFCNEARLQPSLTCKENL